jgi:hypothetical protein
MGTLKHRSGFNSKEEAEVAAAREESYLMEALMSCCLNDDWPEDIACVEKKWGLGFRLGY